MKTVLRAVLGVVVALAVAFALVVGVEWFSSIVHPFPANFDGNIPAHVARYPDWVLGVVVLMYGAIAAVAAWIAARIGTVAAGAVVALLLGAALVFNLSMLPYVTWFKVVMPVAFAGSSWCGLRYCRRPASPGSSIGS